ncbi:MAG: LysR family transcriptional regulator [Syntrophobacter sp.]
MELRELKTFQKVATLLSFNRAADVLHYAQSTVSAQIKTLENELGVPLFDRLGKQIVLTDAGERLLKYSRRLLAIHEETYAEIKGIKELRGSLTIRIPQTLATYYLPPVLAEFQKSYPRVRFEFQGCTVLPLAQELSAGTIDLAFLLTESISSASLQTEILGFEELVLVAHPAHPLAGKSVTEFQDLKGQVFLYTKTDCDYSVRFQKMLADEQIKLITSWSFNSVEAVKQCVMAGLGVTLLPAIAVRREIESGTLAILPMSEAPLEVAIIMIWHKDKWLSPTLDAFLETIKENFSTKTGKASRR